MWRTYGTRQQSINGGGISKFVHWNTNHRKSTVLWYKRTKNDRVHVVSELSNSVGSKDISPLVKYLWWEVTSRAVEFHFRLYVILHNTILDAKMDFISDFISVCSHKSFCNIQFCDTQIHFRLQFILCLCATERSTLAIYYGNRNDVTKRRQIWHYFNHSLCRFTDKKITLTFSMSFVLLTTGLLRNF